MFREEFDNMDVFEQIKYINEKLLEQSLTKICDSIGISRTTVTKRFRSVDYVFDKYTNQYQIADEMKDYDYAINVLEAKINELSEKVTVLEQERNNSATDIQQVDNSNIRFYKNDTIVRAYRIDDEIYQRFKKYTDENKQYKISDIISTALEDFLIKVNK